MLVNMIYNINLQSKSENLMLNSQHTARITHNEILNDCPLFLRNNPHLCCFTDYFPPIPFMNHVSLKQLKAARGRLNNSCSQTIKSDGGSAPQDLHLLISASASPGCFPSKSRLHNERRFSHLLRSFFVLTSH